LLPSGRSKSCGWSTVSGRSADFSLFFFGGKVNTQYYISNEIVKYSSVPETWTFVSTTGQKPKIRKDHGCAKVGNMAYILGGSNTFKYLFDLWSLNLTTNSWKQVSQNVVPDLKYPSMSELDGNNIILVGQDGDNGPSLSCILNLKTFQCNQLEKVPMIDSYSYIYRVVVTYDAVYIMGGNDYKMNHMYKRSITYQ